MKLILCYSRPDLAVAERIRQQLDGHGVEVWRELGLSDSGQKLPKEIETAVLLSDAVALVWSHAASLSPSVKHGWLTAQARKKPIILCPIDDAPIPQELSAAERSSPEKLGPQVAGILKSLLEEKDQGSSQDETLELMSSAGGDPWAGRGDSIGDRYRILRKLGTGGMGTVYLAEDNVLQRRVALKFLSEQLLANQSMTRRLIREARLAAALDHPYICKVFEIETRDNCVFLVLEYLEGQSLKEKLAAGPLQTDFAVSMAVELAEAIQHAHSKGIVHRDLKPANIMLTSDGHVKVLDFGLAKRLAVENVMERDGAMTLTATGTVLGTAPYMSPEQIRGEPVDQRTDLFSFGVILLESLSGKNQFLKSTAADTMTAILTADPLLDEGLTKVLPGRLLPVLSRLLEKDQEKRLESAAALLNMLSSRGEGERKPRWVKALIVFVIAAFLVVLAWFNHLYRWPGPIESEHAPASRNEFEVTELEARARALIENFADPEDLQLSLESWRKILSIHSDYSPALGGSAMARALLVWNSKGTPDSLQNAESEARRAIDADPSNAEAYTALSIIYQLRGLFSAAVEMSEKSVSLGPGDPWILQARARLLMDMFGRFREAANLAERACALEPNHFPAWFQLGWAHYEMEYYEKARQVFEKAISLRPNFAGGYLGIGLVLSSSGEEQESLRFFQKCIDIDAESVQCHLFRGIAFHRTGSNQEALDDFRKVVEINPAHLNSKAAILYQALELKILGRDSEARELLDICERNFKEALSYAFGLRGMAGVELIRGDQEKGLIWLEQAWDKGLRSVHQLLSPDLENLRGNPEFERLVERARLENRK